MMDTSIVYIGQDDHFCSALEATAKNLQTTIFHSPLPENIINELKKTHALIITDRHAPEDLNIIRNISTSVDKYLLIFSADLDSENNDNIPAEFDDLLIKHTNQPYLNRKINFYLSQLRNNTLNGHSDDKHETIKKNNNLTRQIIHLQGQLDRFNTDLQTQEEILNKINCISQLSRQINCLDIKKIALVCIEKIPELISARFASLYTYDERHNRLNLLRHNHPYNIDEQVDLSECPNSPMSIAIEKKKMLLIKDFNRWSESEDVTVNRMFTRNYQSNSCIITPLQSGGHISGLLNLADKIDDASFDHTKDLPPIELLCEIIGSAMSNIKLYDRVRIQARTDGMTGLVNHNTFYNELDKEVNRSNRYGGNLSLIMIDLDHLKEINDQLGHRAGDAMLLHIAEQIRHCIRETDIAARYGGDEFAIILPNTSLSDALIVAQRLLDMVANKSITTDGQTINASISIGLNQYQANFTTEDFMREADIALLDAKNSGKNCIHISESVKH